MAAGSARALGGLAVVLVLLVAAVLGIFSWLRQQGSASPGPGEERCVATASGSSVAVSLEQAGYASIITGVAVRRGLPPRAASIALTTAYQESGIRNLDYGDRDSVGLFQQRPSQGWGTEKQLMDPYYSAGKFYDALVKVKGWRTGDVTEVAQKVQRSGYPDAYRDHEADGRVLASALSGQTPAGFSCLQRQQDPGDAAALLAGLRKTFGRTGATSEDKTVTVTARSTTLAWAYASYAVANAGTVGLVRAQVGARSWETQTVDLPGWTTAAAGVGAREVRLTLR